MIKSISIYRQNPTQDYKVALETTDGKTWVGFFPFDWNVSQICDAVYDRFMRIMQLY